MSRSGSMPTILTMNESSNYLAISIGDSLTGIVFESPPKLTAPHRNRRLLERKRVESVPMPGA